MKKTISAAVATAIAAPLTFGLVAPAQAAEISGAIQSVNVQGTAAPGSVLTVDAAWKVPDGSQPGDTFTLALPAELAPLQTNFPLYSADGTVIANASVANGVVVVTLADAVADRPHSIAGGLKFNVSVTQEATPGKEIVLNWGGVVSAPLVVAGGDGVGPKAEDNSDSVKWPGNTPDGKNTWGIKVTGGKSNVVLTDTPQDHKIQCDYVHVRMADFDGTQYVNYREAGGTLSCDPSLMTYSIAEIPAGSALFFSYEVQEAGKDADGDGQLVNKWDVTSTEMTEGSVATGQSFGAGGWGSGDGATKQVPGDFPTVDLPEAEIPVITEVPGDYPVHEKPEAEIPVITEVPGDYPTAEKPEIVIDQQVPGDYPVHEKPAADVPEITEVPGDFPTVEKPEIVIDSEIPGDFPTVDLPEITIEQEVPGDYPTVDKPAGEIGIVPDTAPVHEKPELEIPAEPETPAAENPAPAADKPEADVEVTPAPKADKPEVEVEETPAPAADKPSITIEKKSGEKVQVVEVKEASEREVVVVTPAGDNVTVKADEIKDVQGDTPAADEIRVNAGLDANHPATWTGLAIAAIIAAITAAGAFVARRMS